MPKLLTEIILPNNQRIIKKYRIEHNHILIQKGKKGFGGKEWAPKFSQGCIIRYGRIFHKEKVVIKDGAEECIDFSKNPSEVPTWDRRAAEKYHQANILEKAGAVEVKASVPIVFYIGLIISVFTLILILTQGRLRF